MTNMKKIIHKDYPYQITIYRKDCAEHEFYVEYNPFKDNEFNIIRFDEQKMVMFKGKYLDDSGYFKDFTLAVLIEQIAGILIIEEFVVSYEEVEEEIEAEKKEDNNNQ